MLRRAAGGPIHSLAVCGALTGSSLSSPSAGLESDSESLPWPRGHCGTRVTNVLIRDEAPADGMGLFEAARLVGYPMSLPNLHSQSSTCITRR